jgi:uncharacterized protein (DUF433 family)
MSEKSYVLVDEHGVMRVGNTRVMLDSVVAAFEEGHSAETIQQQYPALRLEDVYGAIAYYLSHAEEVREYLERQDSLWEELRNESTSRSNPVLKRLRELRAADASRPS